MPSNAWCIFIPYMISPGVSASVFLTLPLFVSLSLCLSLFLSLSPIYLYFRIQHKSVISYKELENRANRSGIFDVSEVGQAVQFLHELGSLQHFTTPQLRSNVVINPQWIVDVMACVVSVKDSHIKVCHLLPPFVTFCTTTIYIKKYYGLCFHSWVTIYQVYYVSLWSKSRIGNEKCYSLISIMLF